MRNFRLKLKILFESGVFHNYPFVYLQSGQIHLEIKGYAIQRVIFHEHQQVMKTY